MMLYVVWEVQRSDFYSSSGSLIEKERIALVTEDEHRAEELVKAKEGRFLVKIEKDHRVRSHWDRTSHIEL